MEKRVQKILSQWGIASRRQAEKMILAGRVQLNGKIVQLGQKADPIRDRLEVDGRAIKSANRPQSVYLLLNKPAGVVSTCRDPRKRPTVLDLLPPELIQGQGIHPVGRLDIDSTGVLLLTNDGALTLCLTHPRYHLSKTYQVWVRGHPAQEQLQTWRQGVFLSGKKTLPAQVKVLRYCSDKTLLSVILREGRNRQIRRVAKQLGFSVIALHRTAIGSIQLQLPDQPMLPSGHYRFLENFEISFLRNQVNLLSEKEPAQIEEHCV